jgi:hypothetical protein
MWAETNQSIFFAENEQVAVARLDPSDRPFLTHLCHCRRRFRNVPQFSVGESGSVAADTVSPPCSESRR